MTLVSADGDQGYPGELLVSVMFTVGREQNSLAIEYSAVTTKPTHVNLTNHSYFNLTGKASEGRLILDHRLQVNANFFTPVDDTLIPTGGMIGYHVSF